MPADSETSPSCSDSSFPSNTAPPFFILTATLILSLLLHYLIILHNIPSSSLILQEKNFDTHKVACHPVPGHHVYGITEWGKVEGMQDMMSEIRGRGPIACFIKATPKLIYFKGGGILSDSEEEHPPNKVCTHHYVTPSLCLPSTNLPHHYFYYVSGTRCTLTSSAWWGGAWLTWM